MRLPKPLILAVAMFGSTLSAGSLDNDRAYVAQDNIKQYGKEEAAFRASLKPRPGEDVAQFQSRRDYEVEAWNWKTSMASEQTQRDQERNRLARGRRAAIGAGAWESRHQVDYDAKIAVLDLKDAQAEAMKVGDGRESSDHNPVIATFTP